MPVMNSVCFRVDGVEWADIHYRYRFVDGFPGGELEITLVDPFIGTVTLNNSFHLELKEGNDPWHTVSFKELVKFLNKAQNTTT